MPRGFGHDYTSAMEAYLADPGEAGLARAYELGRAALTQDLGVLGVAAEQVRALVRLLESRGEPACARLFETLEGFLVETLSPFEITHRGIREANEALHRLNQRLEDEAKRIGHVLHDESGQLLAAVHIALADLASQLPRDLRERVQLVRQLVGHTEEELRRLSRELRPMLLDDLGLEPALRFLADGVWARTQLPVEIDSSLDGRLPHEVEVVLYRVVQEALTNVTKHAGASGVQVRLRRMPEAIQCSVRDDGIGFEAGSRRGAGLGLLGAQERVGALGGTLRIESAPGHGTELVVSIPT